MFTFHKALALAALFWTLAFLRFAHAEVPSAPGGTWGIQEISGGSSSFGDDAQLCFGDSCEYWWIYNSTSTQYELWSTNVNGAGADGLILIADDGAQYINAPAGRLQLATGGATYLNITTSDAHLTLSGSANWRFTSNGRLIITGASSAAVLKNGSTYPLAIGTAITNLHGFNEADSGTGGNFQVEGITYLEGAVAFPPTSVTTAGSPYTVLATDSVILCDSTSGDVTLTLPASAGAGRWIYVKNHGSANNCILDPSGTNNIDNNGAGTNVNVTAGQAVRMLDANKTNYHWVLF